MSLTDPQVQLLRRLAETLLVQAPPLPEGSEELEAAGYVKVAAPQTGTDLTVLVIAITDAGRRALEEVENQ
jgi:hypothetical protein